MCMFAMQSVASMPPPPTSPWPPISHTRENRCLKRRLLQVHTPTLTKFAAACDGIRQARPITYACAMYYHSRLSAGSICLYLLKSLPQPASLGSPNVCCSKCAATAVELVGKIWVWLANRALSVVPYSYSFYSIHSAPSCN